MLSLESELRTLHAEGAIDSATAAAAVARVRRTPFSVFQELRVVLYAGVATFVAGVGLCLEHHLDRIGPAALVFCVGTVAALCYAAAVRMRRRPAERSLAADYVLLLGALLVSADLGYAETQFHWWGADWSRHLFVLAGFHAVIAYAFGSPLVLSLALAALVGALGVERSTGLVLAFDHVAGGTGGRELMAAATIALWRELHLRLKAAPPFADVMEHFAANLGFWGGLWWCASTDRRALGLLVVLGLAGLEIYRGLTYMREILLVYGVVYTVVGLCMVVDSMAAAPSLTVALMLAAVIGGMALLWRLHGRVGRPA